jgi:hypothetical protein
MLRKPSGSIPPEPSVLREVVFHPQYEKERARICGSVRLADDFLAGLESFLSVRPELGYAFRFDSPSNVLTYISKLLPWGERVRVMYAFEENRVVMISAWAIPGATHDPYS